MNQSLTALARAVLPRRVRNALRAPGRSLAWMVNDLRPPLTLAVRPDFSLRCPRNAAEHAFHLQTADPEQAVEFDDFRRVLRRLPHVALVDIGCHFGIFCFAAAHDAGRTARTLAVDPSREADQMVRRIAELNGWTPQVSFIRAAAGDRDGELELVETGATGAGYLVQPHGHPPSERTRVPLLALDTLAERLGEAPTVVKIDVESFELEVLRGGPKTLAGARPVLFIELHNAMMRERGVDPAAVLDQLAAYGYDQLHVGGETFGRDALLGRDIVRVYGGPGGP